LLEKTRGGLGGKQATQRKGEVKAVEAAESRTRDITSTSILAGGYSKQNNAIDYTKDTYKSLKVGSRGHPKTNKIKNKIG
jgi:hypothetical protein